MYMIYRKNRNKNGSCHEAIKSIVLLKKPKQNKKKCKKKGIWVKTSCKNDGKYRDVCSLLSTLEVWRKSFYMSKDKFK